MFLDETLKAHLETSSSIESDALIIAEWNLNIANNISQLGNYRYRPTSAVGSIYKNPASDFDVTDSGNYYTNATYSDITVDGGFNDVDVPITFTSVKEKESMLFSLEDCLGRFRPRSGINKARYFDDRFVHHTNQEMFARPRYYMADKNDKFKYWTSYRTETDTATGENVERGIASIVDNGKFYIDDAAPYVVYKEEIPANRIIVKMQTNVGTVDLGPFSNSYESFADPFFGDSNKTVPLRWRIQYLKNNSWLDAVSFTENSARLSGSAIVPEDGYVEIAYGLLVPEKYRNNFRIIDEITSTELRADKNYFGNAYMIKQSESDLGVIHIWNGSSYDEVVPEYGWFLVDGETDNSIPFVTEFVNPPKYTSVTAQGGEVFREFAYIQGLRIVVETMNKQDSTFDLIEMSPRLTANLSDRTVSYSISKSASDLGISGMPVGQLLASTGSLEVFDYDNAFVESNTNSIIAKYAAHNLQVKTYEVIRNVEFYDYFIPVKTMYIDGFPQTSKESRTVAITLRDLFFYFETLTAPQLFLTNVSLSYAVATLLDSVGFSNYIFLRNDTDVDPIIPYLYVEPDRSVAEILQRLAVSTQSAMFFDEYNNFVMMSKNYIMPSVDERSTDAVFYGSKDYQVAGVINNQTVIQSDQQTGETPKLANILAIASEENKVYNDGVISYTSRYIQRQMRGVEQVTETSDTNKSWVYRPVLLWKGAPIQKLKAKNGNFDTASDALAAIPLNSNLSASIPTVSNHKVIDNVMDVGEGVYFLSRYSGYFYSNGEVIKYDAVEYAIPGFTNIDGSSNFWISSAQEYEKYFSQLPFNGKIYPTGLIRIYSEPNYEVVAGVTRLADGPVAKHGRGQFGTQITSHDAGANSYWTNKENMHGCSMQSKYLFSETLDISKVTLGAGLTGTTTVSGKLSNTEAQRGSVSGLIKNYLSLSQYSESEQNSLLATGGATVQSSALTVAGKSFINTENPLDFISYIPKPLGDKYSHFGTRMRIVGKQLSGSDRTQSPAGSSVYYTVTGTSPDSSTTIGASSGGLGIMLNPETNNGYFFEVAAITEENAEVDNVIFYKLSKNTKYTHKATSNVSGTLSSNIFTASENGALSINSVSAAVGDRVYLSAQTTESQSGYYVVTNAGSSSSKWTMLRDELAVPVKLWGSYSASVSVDDGTMIGMSRTIEDEVATVFDLAVEYENVGSTRRFYLYINGRIIATVDDTDPLPVYNNMALFVRGSSKCMFENVYALGNNYAQNTSFVLDTPVKSIFAKQVPVSDALKKYAINGFVQAAYLGGISPQEPPRYNLYYDEFGTIMREMVSYKIRYDNAYPALYAKMVHNVARIKNLVVSGFMANAYGAEFLVFNATDSALVLNEGGANLSIHGVALTQASATELSVDDYFSRMSDFSNIEFQADALVSSPQRAKELFQDIKTSRLTHGRNAFSLDVPYIQSEDEANDLMAWMIRKIMRPRKSVGVDLFANPTVQLGDIVSINYKDSNGNDEVASEDSRFVVYNIEYSRSVDGPSMTVYLSEVI